MLSLYGYSLWRFPSARFILPRRDGGNRVNIDEGFHVMTAMSIGLGAIFMKRSFHHTTADEFLSFIFVHFSQRQF